MTVTRPATEEDLFYLLEELGIETRTFRHPPIFTFKDGEEVWARQPGGHCKNLFLKDKKDELWLVVTQSRSRVDMKALQIKFGSARLSFGKPDLLFKVLGVTPGSVTPFALMNPSSIGIRVVLEAALLQHKVVNCHPLTNEATTAIAPEDLLRFIRTAGHKPKIISF